MALTEGDKAICGEIAERIIEKVVEQHVKSCPHGQAIVKNKTFVMGCVIGAGVGGGVGGGGLVLAFIKTFMGG